MSKLTGHFKITQQAIKEIKNSCANHLMPQILGELSLPVDVILRDVFDLFGGHWADFGQKHHFMRRFDGQSPRQAYEENVQWIQSNALVSAQNFSRKIKISLKYYTHRNSQISNHASVRTCRLPDMEITASDGLGSRANDRFTGGEPPREDFYVMDYQPFGNALHALQDSFSKGHVVRTEGGTERQPGAIEHIKLYSGEEVKGHSHFDKLWESDKKVSKFSLDGRLAINASKELIFLILNTAQSGVKSPHIITLTGWDDFKNKWLVASEKLSDTRDFAIDLIEEFHTGARLGNTTVVTVNFDEAGLANAMITKFGSNATKVYAVFKRLETGGYNTDIDDIACIYVTKIKKNPLIVNSIRNHSGLVKLLVKSLHMGGLTNTKKDCIRFLTEEKGIILPPMRVL